MEKIGWIILQANQVDVASKVFYSFINGYN